MQAMTDVCTIFTLNSQAIYIPPMATNIDFILRLEVDYWKPQLQDVYFAIL